MNDSTRVLGIYAHPDDGDVGAGGTVAQFVRSGAQASLVLVTSGDAGGYTEEGHDDIVQVRQEEQRAAARAIGYQQVSFLEGYHDGDVRVSRELLRDIVRQIRIHRPEIVFTTSPEHNWESVAASHPDHRAVGEAVVQAIYPAARNPFAYPELLSEEGLEPWVVKEVWMQGHPQNNHYVALEPEDLECKAEAIRCHASQFVDPSRVEEMIRQRAAALAQQEGIDTDHAEGFFRYYTA